MKVTTMIKILYAILGINHTRAQCNFEGKLKEKLHGMDNFAIIRLFDKVANMPNNTQKAIKNVVENEPFLSLTEISSSYTLVLALLFD